jgi:CheY-like chemotaxis protein
MSISNLIREVYIDPIRSVLVIDDEFISLDKMLEYNESLFNGDINTKETIEKEYPNGLDLKRAKEIIFACRQNGRNWLCDIHDGKVISDNNEQSNLAKHLHQSDLLILDYNLTADNSDGTRALSLIEHLVNNTHFNLVVVYTASDVSNVVKEIAQHLSYKSKVLDELEINHNAILSEWSIENKNIFKDCEDLIDEIQLLNIIQNIELHKKNLESQCFYNDLVNIFNTKPSDLSHEVDLPLLFILIIKLGYEAIRHSLMNKFEISNYIFNDGQINWIKNERLFITVVSKNKHSPAQLPVILQEALVKWNPKPQRLLISKLRSELDRKGIYLEDFALSNDYTHAGWLKEFLTSDDADIRWVTKNTINRIWENISEEMMNSLEDYSKRLKKVNTEDNLESVIKTYHKLDITDKKTSLNISKHMNSYACSKTVAGNQITTGHILKLVSQTKINDNIRENIDYFVCLTPACDLVPTQTNDWKSRLSELMPIHLVKLHPSETCFPSSAKKCTYEKLLSDLNSNNHLLLNIEGTIEGFSILKTSNANPQWEQAFINNKGGILWDKTQNVPSVTLVRSYYDLEKLELTSSSHKPTIVAQLRYEYAINLLQKFGFSQSRVGLDFIEYRS